jgi:CBS domain-containing protein
MLSYSDLLRISYSDVSEDEQSVETFMYDMYTIKQVMAKNLYMVPPYASVKDVAELLSKQEFHALPVVEDNELVGIVTTTDLINYLIEQL